MRKARTAKEARDLEEFPNVGPATVRDFVRLGIRKPADLKTRDAYMLYLKLCRKDGVRHDPCVLDVFLSVIDFMNGAPPRPWFFYTISRKKRHPSV